VKDFEHRIDPAFSHLITVALVATLNQISKNSQALTDRALPF
jgi:hypothetical protein